MSLIPIVQPPLMKALTTRRERLIRMEYAPKPVSQKALLFFPILLTLVVGLLVPEATPLISMLMLGNLLKASGVVDRLSKAAQNEIINIATLFLGIAIGATMGAEAFLKPTTLAIFGLGFVAICLDTVAGVLFGKLWYALSGGRINPLIGAAGISAYPMAARVVQAQGQRYDKHNFLLMQSTFL